MGNKEDRKNEAIHDLVHMLVDAKAWIERIDKKVQEIILQDNSQRKDDK